jgi:nitrite reductase/ring-hydroxylating ferredoxin subunit
MLLGHANGEAVLLARRDDEWFAIGAICTHYGAPLGDGLLVGDTVRCPWHHACFSLRSGEPPRPPALDPVSCWRVDQRDGKVYVREKLARADPQRLPLAREKPQSVLIVGGGGAGNMAAETLRCEGFSGRIIMLSADASGPCDRPNLSKGFLAGTAAAESNPLRPPAFYREHGIDLKLDALVASLDTQSRHVLLADGSRHA